ncbi:putative bifunctional diguanylate cyclase/phosphodiesterase [Bacterioplanes sanyensis]|nr:EAL domain-containing protein [Bacterioplanes sanyensis]
MNNALAQTTTLRQQLASIVGAIPYGIIAVSEYGDVEIVNHPAVAMLGHKNKSPKDFVDDDIGLMIALAPDIYDKYERLILSSKRSSFIEPCRPTGLDTDLVVTCQKMLTGTLFVIEDRTERKALLYDLSHDFLTRLLNHQYFEIRLRLAVEKSKDNGACATFIFIDLDRFKLVDDIAGHAAGDDMLRRVAIALESCVSSQDVVARPGGDEFAVLVYNASTNQAKDIAHKMLKKVESLKLLCAGKVVDVSLSAGIAAVDSEQFEDIRLLVNAADAACRYAKNDAETRVHLIESDYREYRNYLQETNLNHVVNDAIANDEFYLVAQEIRSLNSDKRFSHYEILIRLKDEEGKNIAPNIFIPVAERSRVMAKNDRWVIQEAFSMMRPDMCLSINLSGQSFSDLTLVEFIVNMTDRYQVSPRSITFEITETAAIENIDKTKEFISALRKLGYKFSLDDFGTGLSSYQYLKDLPVDHIKIDGYFVKDIEADTISCAMVQSINDFVHKIGLKTIAEFVSSEGIEDKLKEMGVDYAQGFHVARPVPLADIVAA